MSNAYKELGIVEVAKIVRSDIKAAVEAGVLPEGLKASVKSSKKSLDIEITKFDQQFFSDKYITHRKGDGKRWDSKEFDKYTDDLYNTMRTLSVLANNCHPGMPTSVQVARSLETSKLFQETV